MTDRSGAGHQGAMMVYAMATAAKDMRVSAGQEADASREPPAFEDIYEAHFDFVWSCVRRLGVAPPATDDAVQEVFIVVHRKLPEFEHRSSLRTWLYGIAQRVVQQHRRRAKRKPEAPLTASIDERLKTDTSDGPHARTASKEAASLLRCFLDELPDEQRVVFVGAEIEGLSAPELAEATGTRLNTVYSRLRLARAAFERCVERFRAQSRDARPMGEAESASERLRVRAAGEETP